MRTLFTLLAAASLLACAQLPDRSPAVEQERLRAHIEFLASDALEGRNAGTTGYDVAAEYVAAEFRQLGLVPAGTDGSYFQQVPLREHSLVKGSASVVIESAAGRHALSYPEDFIMGPDRNRPVARLDDAEMVFVGYGIVAADYRHDDYAGLDVEGKIAVFLTGRPRAWPTEEGAHLASGTQKARYAVERGAIGVIALHTPRSEAVFPWEDSIEHLDQPGMSWIGPDGLPDDYFTEIQGGATLNLAAAAVLFDGAPVTLEEVYRRDTEQEAIEGFPLAGKISLARKSSYRELSSPNVIGVIEGSDPVLKNEVIVYSAHLDHLGIIPNEEGVEEIYNGAMDNAAGIATLLETARILKDEGLKRSVMFLAVTAEEKGLLGAGYFANNPTVPIENIVANINLDMPVITYPFADVVAFGSEHSSLKDTVAAAAEGAGIKLSPDPMPEQGLFTRSDHYELVKKGVPAVFLMTGFESKDPDQSGAEVWQAHLKDHYHQPSDDLNLPIDYQAGAVFTEINVNIGREIGDGAARPHWNAGDFFGREFGSGAQLAPPPVAAP
jgi:hypothetical protein